jgi:hypothetical protein
VVTAHLSLMTRSNSSIVYTKPTPELEAMHKYLTVSTNFYYDEWKGMCHWCIYISKCDLCYFAHLFSPSCSFVMNTVLLLLS